MTDINTRLQELQDTIKRAEAELAALHASPMQQAIDAYRVPSCSADSNKEIEAGLRAAWPYLKAAMENDGDWIPWTGGECPVPSETRVQVRLRDDVSYTEPADDLAWYHDGPNSLQGSSDIVAYRVCN